MGPSTFCRDHTGVCNCASTSSSFQQSLDEVDFMRSACAAAKSGQLTRLAEILRKKPEAVHEDGTDGSSGYSPLHYASRSGHREVVLLLLEYGAVVDKRTCAGGATSLHRAAHMGHTEIVKILLSSGANGLIQDKDGETPLHKALKEGHTPTAEVLLDTFPEAAFIKDRHGIVPNSLLRQVG